MQSGLVHHLKVQRGQIRGQCVLTLARVLALNKASLNGHNDSSVCPLTLIYDFLKA